MSLKKVLVGSAMLSYSIIGCGYKGPLYLPPKQPTSAPSPVKNQAESINIKESESLNLTPTANNKLIESVNIESQP